jgi:hypothetical protein
MPSFEHIAIYMLTMCHFVHVITTIQIRPETRTRLAALKSDPRETYDGVLNRLLALVPPGDAEGPYTEAFRVGLLAARLDIREGRLLDHKEVKQRLGL